MNSRCYTFYSYKGGSGRTTTLLNTTKHLAEILDASSEKPILLIDADLESAGLTYFFKCEKKFTSRFNCTIHAEEFLNFPKRVLTGVRGDNTFGKSRERLVPCQAFASRIAALFPASNAETLLSGVMIRETISQIFDRILRAHEVANEESKNQSEEDAPKTDDAYWSEAYSLRDLLDDLANIDWEEQILDKASAKRTVIEEFLPTDSMVDVSAYFGRPFGSVKFIGVDVAFNGTHSSLTNMQAFTNKMCIASECGKRGFSTVLFDSGAGVQSTAHVLNHVSDVIVYCMRPTYQFISGTINQIETYRDSLGKIADTKNDMARDEGKPATKKSVILLPTAVPHESQETQNLQKDSFNRIQTIASLFDKFIDDTFCTYQTSLKEVALFKWREHILGTAPVNVGDMFEEDISSTIEPYANYESMPDDAKHAYETYRLLAQRLYFNS